VRVSQAVGRSLEEWIRWSAWNDPNLTLVKQFPEVRFIHGKPVVTAKGAPDYVGWVGDYALGVVFDAKSTQAKQVLYAPADRKHQFEFMQDAVRRHPRIVAFYLVEWRKFEVFEVFPVSADSTWPFVMRRGEGVFSTSDLGEVWKYLRGRKGFDGG